MHLLSFVPEASAAPLELDREDSAEDATGKLGLVVSSARVQLTPLFGQNAHSKLRTLELRPICKTKGFAQESTALPSLCKWARGTTKSNGRGYTSKTDVP